MDKKIMERLEDNFCEVLRDFAEKGFQRADDVETAKAALSGMVKMKMLEEMERFHNGGYSNRMYHDDGGEYSSRGRYYRDDGGSYDNGNSYRYYRDDGKQRMVEKLNEMKNHADPNNRQMIEEWLKQLQR